MRNDRYHADSNRSGGRIMGLYIKGMRMPEKCVECRFADWSSLHRTASCKLKDYEPCFSDYSTEYITQRSEHCPLVELPDHHGRLIDENEVRTVMNWLLTQPQRPTWNDTYHAIQEMNATVEAE